MYAKNWVNDVYQALKVNICSLLHHILDLVPKNLVEALFLIIYTPFLLVLITIDIQDTVVAIEKFTSAVL